MLAHVNISPAVGLHKKRGKEKIHLPKCSVADFKVFGSFPILKRESVEMLLLVSGQAYLGFSVHTGHHLEPSVAKAREE